MPTKWRNAGSDFLQFFYCTIKKRKCKGRRETGRKGINIVYFVSCKINDVFVKLNGKDQLTFIFESFQRYQRQNPNRPGLDLALRVDHI